MSNESPLQMSAQTMSAAVDSVSYAANQITSTDPYFTAHKAATTVAYVFLIILTWRFLTHRLDWTMAIGCLALSSMWLVLIRLKMSTFLATYFDVFSRLEIVIPCCIGLLLSTVAFFSHGSTGVHATSLTEFFLWLWVYLAYRTNKQQYVIQGHGPVPRGTWINPPDDILRPGDLLLTSGNIATQLHECVGHAATVVRLPDGSMQVLSSHIDKGTNLEPLAHMTGDQKRNGHFIALHLAHPISEQQLNDMGKIAEEMVAENKAWAIQRNAQIQTAINGLPLPDSLRIRLCKRLHASGYDWFGTFMGRIAPHRWTCIGSAVELYRRLGIETRPYGTGLLGVGTTLFDPIMPVRFLNDPAFVLIKRPVDEQAITSTAKTE